MSKQGLTPAMVTALRHAAAGTLWRRADGRWVGAPAGTVAALIARDYIRVLPDGPPRARAEVTAAGRTALEVTS